MAVTIYSLPGEPMQGDVDNIVKLILDALCKHIYFDDKQVERVVVQKFEPGNAFTLTEPSELFVQALEAPKPIVYIRVTNDPFEDLK